MKVQWLLQWIMEEDLSWQFSSLTQSSNFVMATGMKFMVKKKKYFKICQKELFMKFLHTYLPTIFSTFFFSGQSQKCCNSVSWRYFCSTWNWCSWSLFNRYQPWIVYWRSPKNWSIDWITDWYKLCRMYQKYCHWKQTIAS